MKTEQEVLDELEIEVLMSNEALPEEIRNEKVLRRLQEESHKNE